MEDMYTNGPAALVSPAQTQGQEARKVRLIQFEKVTEEPMVTLVFCHHHPPTPTGLPTHSPKPTVLSPSRLNSLAALTGKTQHQQTLVP